MPTDPLGLRLKFWGVRGSTPTPSIENLGYGGNTACMEILSGGGQRIIIDAGTGIRQLGRSIAGNGSRDGVDLFLTHFHWDHIQGIPFFVPFLTPGVEVRFHSFLPGVEIERRLQRQMSEPYFTLDFNAAAGARQFHQVENCYRKGGLTVTPFPLHHPQGASGYRIECDGKCIVIATDLEHGNARLDRALRDYAEGADVLVYDAQYTPAEYQSRVGWGHSSYDQAASVAIDAHVKKLVLFHHDPTHDDSAVDAIVEQATTLFENTVAARELQTITL